VNDAREPSRPIKLDLEGLTEEQLLEKKLDIDTEIGSIKSQIEQARIEAAEDGRYADRDWWQRANAAMKIKGNQSQQVQIRLRVMKRERHEKLMWERHFVLIAKRRLSEELFDEIHAKAKEAAKSGSPEENPDGFKF
jgi:hypothetical protein